MATFNLALPRCHHTGQRVKERHYFPMGGSYPVLF